MIKYMIQWWDDLFWIAPIINETEHVVVSKSIRSDIDEFLDKNSNEIIDLKNFGVYNRPMESVMEMYDNIYICR
jgi:hypothetical protein